MAANNSELLSVLSVVVSALAFTVSAITAWLTLFRRGTLKMTQPTQIFFGYDKSRDDDERAWPKVFLCTLLFVTSKRGLVIENLYVKLTCEDITQTFSIWVHGHNNELVRGAGLFVGDTGVQANHHFLTSENDEPFHFIAGNYQFEVHANILGQRDSCLLFSCALNVSLDESDSIGHQHSGLYFDWGPDEKQYTHHVKRAPKSFWDTE